MADGGASFRFMDLPAELRNKIYRELLCSFAYNEKPIEGYGSSLAELIEGEISSINRAILIGDVSILLANRKTYHEAYVAIVKTNRFVCIRSHNYTWPAFTNEYKIPIVTWDCQHVAKFRSYVLCMTIEQEGATQFDSDAEVCGATLDCKSLGTPIR